MSHLKISDLFPLSLGEIVMELMVEFFPEIIDVEFTAKMEQDLDQVEEGKVNWVKIIDDFYKDFEKHLEKAEKEMQKVEIKDEPAGEDCEQCGNPMVFKMGRYGKFMACSNFPDCRNTKAIVKEIGVKCPKCDEGKLLKEKVKRDGSFMDVIDFQNVIFFRGINHYREIVQNVKLY